jgi:hypothetical protein
MKALHADRIEKLCVNDGCERKATRRGLCSRCYQRAVFRGDALPPLTVQRFRRSLRERFEEKTKQADSIRSGMETPCLLWVGYKDKSGYGRLGVGSREDGTKRNELSHRIAWVLKYGDVADDICVLHRCDNPQCVNVEHLFLGTKADNNHDMVAKGRMVFQTHPEKRQRGESHFAAKLTKPIVIEIRRSNRSSLSWARQLGMAKSTIQAARNRHTWRHVQPSCLMAAQSPAAARACGSVLCE